MATQGSLEGFLYVLETLVAYRRFTQPKHRENIMVWDEIKHPHTKFNVPTITSLSELFRPAISQDRKWLDTGMVEVAKKTTFMRLRRAFSFSVPTKKIKR